MLHERFDVRAETQGRWRGILAALGLNAAQVSGKRTECPICRNGPKSDSFRLDDKDGRGTWFCNHDGAGDGVALVMKMRGVDFKGALELIRPLVGAVPFSPPKADRDTTPEAREEMAALWKRAKPLDGHCAASRYLRSRGIDLAVWPAALRLVDELPLTEDGTNVRRIMPAMLARFFAPDGTRGILHRTWLPDVWRPGVKVCRKMWRGAVPSGGAVRLGPAAEVLGICEGIETSFAASILHRIPVWAALSAVCLIKWDPPPEAKEIVVFGDNDMSFTGQMAAYSLAHRLRLKQIPVSVCVPDKEEGSGNVDWNDVLINTNMERV